MIALNFYWVRILPASKFAHETPLPKELSFSQESEPPNQRVRHPLGSRQ
ncbi:hypothetical protein SAMN02745127_02348 [Oceanospirillum multiglobuliferum]|nr:hypothetical protein SAMN02745127_02348 [Oceanospirillum multiglobuliferum]